MVTVAKPVILVGDDSVEIIDLISNTLRAVYQVKAATSGAKALEIAVKSPPDLILLDIVMPEMDGFDVLRQLKSRGETRSIPVIFLTSRADEESEATALEAGGSDFISKPVSPHVLHARVSTQLLVTEQRLAIQRERNAYQQLLQNVLPAHIVERLNRQEEIADQLDDVGVLFADLVGFTSMAETLPAPVLVAEIKKVFLAFDQLVALHKVEKIKTIGDCYMVASNLNDQGPEHHIALVEFGLDAIACMENMRSDLIHPFELRVGIHCGPVVAGVLEGSRSIYDIWGDTVNTAERFESSGLPGRIHVSEKIAEKLAGSFDFEKRATVELKGKGSMESYLVKDIASFGK